MELAHSGVHENDLVEIRNKTLMPKIVKIHRLLNTVSSVVLELKKWLLQLVMLLTFSKQLWEGIMVKYL